MSANGDRNIDKKDKKRRYGGTTAVALDWRQVGAGIVLESIGTVTATGCAIRFGYSRDRGAFAIGIVGDGDPYTVWAANVDEVEFKLEALCQAFHADSK